MTRTRDMYVLIYCLYIIEENIGKRNDLVKRFTRDVSTGVYRCAYTVFFELFEKLRGDYPIRREFTAFSINLVGADDDIVGTLKEIGFNIN